MLAPLLLVWVGLMGAAALGLAWFTLSRFPEVFFRVQDWQKVRKGRIVRVLLAAGIGLFACLVIVGIVLLLGPAAGS